MRVIMVRLGFVGAFESKKDKMCWGLSMLKIVSQWERSFFLEYWDYLIYVSVNSKIVE